MERKRVAFLWSIVGSFLVIASQIIAVPYQPRINVNAIGMVVKLEGEREEWVGTCFAISPRLVLTASHVIEKVEHEEMEKESRGKIRKEEFSSLYVRFRNRTLLAEKVWEDKAEEISVLRVTTDSLPSYISVDFREVGTNEELWICGYIDKQLVTIPIRVINPAFYLKWGGENEILVILASPAAWHGTSGSPVLDRDGEAVAIHIGRLGTAISVETPLVKAYKSLRSLLRDNS